MPGQPSNLEEGFFPVIWAQLPKKGFNIDPPSVKLFFQNRNQGGYGNPSISNLTMLCYVIINNNNNIALFRSSLLKVPGSHAVFQRVQLQSPPTMVYLRIFMKRRCMYPIQIENI